MYKEEQILICAVRYALGRQSYIVGEICDYVYDKRKELSKECKDIIVKDILDVCELYRRAGSTLGTVCDERSWLELVERLRTGD